MPRFYYQTSALLKKKKKIEEKIQTSKTYQGREGETKPCPVPVV